MRTTDPQRAIIVAQTLIKQQLDEDTVAQFAPIELTHVENLGDRYRVSGAMEAISRTTSIALSYHYSLMVYRNADGDWVGEKLEFVQQ